MYKATYQINGNNDEAERNSVDALNNQSEYDVELNEVIENCKNLTVDADLFDAAGFTKGTVHRDGSYSLN